MSTQNKTAIPNSLNEHWMPFTSNKDFKENPRLIVEAKGVYLKNHQGQTQIDASSGLFCNPLGHDLMDYKIIQNLHQFEFDLDGFLNTHLLPQQLILGSL